MKKVISLFLSAIMFVSVITPFFVYAENSSGTQNNISWELIDGVLTISGTGVCGGFRQRSDITKVIINEGITEIGNSGFENCKNIKEVYFPESLTGIHKYAFRDCEKLEKADLPRNLKYVGVCAFKFCLSLKKIEIPKSMKDIHQAAFGACSSASGKLIIPSGCTVHPYAFNYCESLTELYFEDGFTIPESINTYTYFSHCESVKSIYIPGSVKQIPREYFSSCYSLDNLTLSEGIESISGFSGCKSLRSVTLPKSVKVLERDAFYECEKLKSVKIQSKIEMIEAGAFLNCPSLKSLKFPYGVERVDEFYPQKPLGYMWFYRDDNNTYASVKGFKIYGKKCKALTDYCKENGFKFIDMYDVKNATVSGLSSKAYTGKAIKPDVTVKLAGTTLKKDTDYTVKYSNNTKVGTAKVTLTGKGKYKGTLTKTFKINPKPTELTKLTSGSKSFKAYWKKNTTQTSGYQIQYSTYKDFKNAKTVSITTYKTGARTIKKLKAKKKYFVRIRTYKTVNKVKYYSKWSESKNIKTK